MNPEEIPEDIPEELKEKMEAFHKEFMGETDMCDQLLKAYMEMPPMAELATRLIRDKNVSRKELFQIAFFQGVICTNQALNPEALMHEHYKKYL